MAVATSEIINKCYRRATVYTNVPNQKNYCAPLSLAIALGRPYTEVNEDLKAAKVRANDQAPTYTHLYMAKRPQNFKDVTKDYTQLTTVAAFTRRVKKGRFVVMVNRHVVAVVNGVLYNTLTKGRRARIERIYEVIGNEQTRTAQITARAAANS